MSSTKPGLEGLRIEREPENETKGNPWLWIAGGIALASILAAIGWWRSGSGAIEVRTAVARELSGGSGDRTVLNASGYVTARRAATVSSKVTGKVVEVLIEEGMKVTEGQVLARLDDTNVRAGLEVAKAQLESARKAQDEIRAQLRQAELEFQRATNLAGQQITSQSELDRAEAEAKTLAARLARQRQDIAVAERQVAQWQQQLDDLVIRAPFAGVITTKDAQPGEMISPVSAGGGYTRTGIGTVVDMQSLEIEIDVNESYIGRVAENQPVEATLDAYPGWKIACRVIAIIPTADRQKSTVRVRVGFDGLDPRILPEMSVKVAFHGGGAVPAARTVVVPRTALLSQDGRDVVFLVRNGRAERRAVTVNQAQNEDAVLGSGVSAGEIVVLNPPPQLADGTRVKEMR